MKTKQTRCVIVVTVSLLCTIINTRISADSNACPLNCMSGNTGMYMCVAPSLSSGGGGVEYSDPKSADNCWYNTTPMGSVQQTNGAPSAKGYKDVLDDSCGRNSYGTPCGGNKVVSCP